MPIINVHADVSSKASVPNFVQSIHLHPYHVCAYSEGSGECVHMRRLAREFAAVPIESGFYEDNRVYMETCSLSCTLYTAYLMASFLSYLSWYKYFPSMAK